MMVFSLGMFLIQDSELGMHGGIQRKALSSGCCFQGILAIQLFQQTGREGQSTVDEHEKKREEQIHLTYQSKLQTRKVTAPLNTQGPRGRRPPPHRPGQGLLLPPPSTSVQAGALSRFPTLGKAPAVLPRPRTTWGHFVQTPPGRRCILRKGWPGHRRDQRTPGTAWKSLSWSPSLAGLAAPRKADDLRSSPGG